MSKHYGAMMGGRDALAFLDRVYEQIDVQEEGFEKSFDRMKNRFACLVDHAEPVKLKYHKGRSRLYDYWTCQNCGCEITHSVIQNFCWNCGHAIEWEWPRCLTGQRRKEGGDDGTKKEERRT